MGEKLGMLIEMRHIGIRVAWASLNSRVVCLASCLYLCKTFGKTFGLRMKGLKHKWVGVMASSKARGAEHLLCCCVKLGLLLEMGHSGIRAAWVGVSTSALTCGSRSTCRGGLDVS